MRYLISLCFLIISALSANFAMSAMTVDEYKKAKINDVQWPVTQVYLEGVGVGASVTAALLLQHRMQPLFCQPEGIELKQKNYIDLIDAFLAKNKMPEGPITVEAILLMSLITAFPCSSK